MENTSMTALVSAFARSYHAAHKKTKIFDDPLARQLLSDEESRAIAQNMADGIAFFSPGFCGTQAEALRRIMDCHLSPTPLGRAEFAERALHTAVRCGARQYLAQASIPSRIVSRTGRSRWRFLSWISLRCPPTSAGGWNVPICRFPTTCTSSLPIFPTPIGLRR